MTIAGNKLAAMIAALSGALLAAPVARADVLYSNGPVNGNLASWLINSPDVVADSFTLTGSSILSGVTLATWVTAGDTLSTVNWEITSAPGNSGTVYATGTGNVAVTGTILTPNSFGDNVYTDSFSITPLSLGAGTYWLNLQNAVVSNGGLGFWDQNNGPSQAWESPIYNTYLGNNDGTGCPDTTCSETFSIIGATTTNVPEPGSLAIVASALLGLGVVARRKRR